MISKFLSSFLLIALFFSLISPVLAIGRCDPALVPRLNVNDTCRENDGTPLTDRAHGPNCLKECDFDKNLVCLENSNPATCVRDRWTCQGQDSTIKVFGPINPPEGVLNLGFGSYGVSRVLSNIIQLIFIFAGIIFLFMVIFSGVQWLTSGGDKEGVAKARARITYAVIGIIVLALAFLLLRVIGGILGFDFFFNNIGSACPGLRPPSPSGPLP